MARIRSTFPEQWVDEEFVTGSPLARLLAIGVRNFADDNGVFEWKPLKLKMQILPADNCDMDELLQELLLTNQISRFEVEGKTYGIIRNFTKFQKPKSPKGYYPLPPEPLANGYVTKHPTAYESSEPAPPIDSASSEQFPNLFGNSSSEGGGRGEKDSVSKDTDAEASPDDPVKVIFDTGVRILTDGGSTEKQARSLVGKWRKEVGDEKLATLLVQAPSKTEPVAWLTKAVQKPQPVPGL